MENMFAVTKAQELCANGGHKLLYLSRFGSHLYGTNTPNSDEDFKGVFLPRLTDLMMGKRAEPIGYQSKDDPTHKNTKDDIDLQLFPIQFWLNKLVRKGETEGIELLYSYTNREAVLFIESCMEDVFMNKTSLFDPRNTQGFLGFAIGQARTYFTKAERFNVIKDVFYYVRDLIEMGSLTKENLLRDIFDEVIGRFSHPTYCSELESNGLRAIQLCSKVHQETINIGEFFERISREYKKYGHRTKAAADLDNKDWKSLSHALKAIIEVRMLLDGMILDFPLQAKDRDLLRSIKMGEVEFEKVEQLILSGIDEVDALKAQFDNPYWQYNADKVRAIIASMYGVGVV